MRIAIVGSGLSGLACAHALIRRGIRPTIVDAGITLDPTRAAVAQRMASVEPSDWTTDDLDTIRQNDTLNQRGIPRKLVFGSDYIYARDHPAVGLSGKDVKASTTLAKGGFGTAWGAAVLPAAQNDLSRDWPSKASDLGQSYAAIMSWLPLSASTDRLSDEFPTYKSHTGSLDLPEQAQALLRDLDQVEHESLVFGQARLAIHTSGANACRYCGQCLSGCVYGSIFDPCTEVDRLASDGSLVYEPGWLVRAVYEDGDRVQLNLERLGSGEREERILDRVLLAAGAINSTRIVLRSLERYDHTVEFADSQKFLVPVFRRAGSAYDTANMNALAALFLELRVPDLGEEFMHVQLSTVNDFVLRRLRADRNPVMQALLAPLLKRSLFAWCSLHSRHSAKLVASLRKQDTGDSFEIREAAQERAKQSVRVAVRHFASLAPKFRSLIVPSMVSLSATGAGNHIGGAMRMRERPNGALDTDLLGRPSGLQRVHVVDSAVLPSVPATTIALLTMANADRIATHMPLG